VFGVRESLIVPFVLNDSKDIAQQLNIYVPFFIVDYDFVLNQACLSLRFT